MRLASHVLVIMVGHKRTRSKITNKRVARYLTRLFSDSRVVAYRVPCGVLRSLCGTRFPCQPGFSCTCVKGLVLLRPSTQLAQSINQSVVEMLLPCSDVQVISEIRRTLKGVLGILLLETDRDPIGSNVGEPLTAFNSKCICSSGSSVMSDRASVLSIDLIN